MTGKVLAFIPPKFRVVRRKDFPSDSERRAAPLRPAPAQNIPDERLSRIEKLTSMIEVLDGHLSRLWESYREYLDSGRAELARIIKEGPIESLSAETETLASELLKKLKID